MRGTKRLILEKAGERTISVKELAAPLLAVQSDTDHPVTSDDNIARTPGDSPVPIPASIVKSSVPPRLKKTKGKKGKHPSYQSR